MTVCRSLPLPLRFGGSIWTTKYTDKPLQLHVVEREEAMHYTVSTNGMKVPVFRLQLSNKFRDVVLSETAKFGAICSCRLPEAWRIKCRHILETEEHAPQLKNNECNSPTESTCRNTSKQHSRTKSHNCARNSNSRHWGFSTHRIGAPHYEGERTTQD